MCQHVVAASQELTASVEHMVADSVVNIAEGASQQAVEAGNIQVTAEDVTTHTKVVLDNAVSAKSKINDGRQSIQEAVHASASGAQSVQVGIPHRPVCRRGLQRDRGGHRPSD